MHMFFFSSRRRHTRFDCDWSSDVCSSDLRFVGRGIRRRFADTRGMSVLGVGYPTPYLGLFREEAERCLAFMPAVQGGVKWPTDRPGLAALVDELDLPLTDSAVDRVLLAHALEMARHPIA